MKIMEDETCRLCMDEVEAEAHFVCSCPALANIRLWLIGNAIIGTEPMSDRSVKNMPDITRIM